MPEYKVDYTQALLVLLYIFIGVIGFIMLILICRRKKTNSKTTLWKSFIKELGYRDPQESELFSLKSTRHSTSTQLGRFSTAGWTSRGGSYSISHSLKSKTSSRGPSIVITESENINRISNVPSPEVSICIGDDGRQQNPSSDTASSSSGSQYLQVPLLDILEEDEDYDQTPEPNSSTMNHAK